MRNDGDNRNGSIPSPIRRSTSTHRFHPAGTDLKILRKRLRAGKTRIHDHFPATVPTTAGH